MAYHRFYYYLKSQWQLIIVCLLALAFFFFVAVFNFKTQDEQYVKWLSPDETANYAVAKNYALTGSLMYFEKNNLLTQELIHPRSFRSDWGWVKPVSFIGLPLYYGAIASFLGIGVLPYLTPLVGAIGIIFFYLLVKELFGKTTGLVAAALLATFPIYTYFSARSFFHNILFIVATLIGVYFIVKAGKRPRTNEGTAWQRYGIGSLLAFFGGIGIGVAAAARTSELIWLAPFLLGLYIFNIRRFGPLKLYCFFYGALLALAPVMYWNEVMYGSWYAMGYPEVNSSLNTLGTNGSSLAQTAASGKWYDIMPLIEKLKSTVFHFGFKPGQSKRMAEEYIWNMFRWLVWLAGAGIFLFLVRFRQYTKGKWLMLLSWLALSGLLILYYGSWIFFDNPDPRSFSIGNSYTRYWLPVYLGAIMFASFAITTVSGWLRKKYLIAPVCVLAVAAIAYISITFVWNEPSEGIAVSIEKQIASRSEWSQLLSLTEPDAVVITRYHDKLLFPERRVIIGLFNDKNMTSLYARLAKRVPLYYYNFSYSDKDLAYLNAGPLREAGIALVPVRALTDRFTLYRVQKAEIVVVK